MPQPHNSGLEGPSHHLPTVPHQHQQRSHLDDTQLSRLDSNDINNTDVTSEPNSPPSTALSSRSPTPEPPYGDNMLDLYLERLGMRKPVFTTQLDLQTESRRHINDLPMDVIVPIVSHLDNVLDLMSFITVQPRWLLVGASRIWYKPVITTRQCLGKICSVLTSEPTVDYHLLVHRLNLSLVSRHLTDKELLAFKSCTNIDRLVLSNCNGVSPNAIGSLVSNMPHLQSIDLQDVVGVNDHTLEQIANNCPELQVFYGGGDAVTDAGLASLLALKRTLRRIILSRCKNVTSEGVINLVSQCTQLVELDLTGLRCFKNDNPLFPSMSFLEFNDELAGSRASSGLTNDNARALLSNCTGLRDLRLDGSSSLSAPGFNLSRGLRVVNPRLDSLRVVSLSMCPRLDDEAISQLVQIAPRVRHINLGKCPLITDRGVSMIAEAYGHGLHYLHLGHCTKITDRAVTSIADNCPRLSFFDAANCANLTNVSLIVLARLPKLRRIGVVKCNDIGAPGVMALAQRPPGCEGERPIERLHLSYCSSISIRAIKMVLDACPRLVHLSLTGVRAFMRTDIMRLSRPPPPELNEHQRQVFCVFSGSGIADLREVLKDIYEPPGVGPWLSPTTPVDPEAPRYSEFEPRPDNRGFDVAEPMDLQPQGDETVNAHLDRMNRLLDRVGGPYLTEAVRVHPLTEEEMEDEFQREVELEIERNQLRSQLREHIRQQQQLERDRERRQFFERQRHQPFSWDESRRIQELNNLMTQVREQFVDLGLDEGFAPNLRNELLERTRRDSTQEIEDAFNMPINTYEGHSPGWLRYTLENAHNQDQLQDQREDQEDDEGEDQRGDEGEDQSRSAYPEHARAPTWNETEVARITGIANEINRRLDALSLTPAQRVVEFQRQFDRELHPDRTVQRAFESPASQAETGSADFTEDRSQRDDDSEESQQASQQDLNHALRVHRHRLRRMVMRHSHRLNSPDRFATPMYDMENEEENGGETPENAERIREAEYIRETVSSLRTLLRQEEGNTFEISGPLMDVLRQQMQDQLQREPNVRSTAASHTDIVDEDSPPPNGPLEGPY